MSCFWTFFTIFSTHIWKMEWEIMKNFLSRYFTQREREIFAHRSKIIRSHLNESFYANVCMYMCVPLLFINSITQKKIGDCLITLKWKILNYQMRRVWKPLQLLLSFLTYKIKIILFYCILKIHQTHIFFRFFLLLLKKREYFKNHTQKFIYSWKIGLKVSMSNEWG